MAADRSASAWQIALGLFAIYVIWGSTYLAIRFAIETLPPFLMAGVRFLVAGAVLYALVRPRVDVAPTPRQWRSATIVGALLLLGGNGLVSWAEQWIASGLAALLVATVPLFMVLHGWSWGGERRPGWMTWTGLAVGFVGVALLVGPERAAGPEQLVGALAVIVGALLWSGGSIYSRGADLPSSPLLATAMEMLSGGALLLVVGSALGEWSQVSLAAVSLRSWLALAYLIVFGSLVAFSAYIWVLRVASAATVSTYAYVNPVVAVFLGWLLANEVVTLRTVVASALVLAAVMLITLRRRAPVRAVPEGDAQEGDTWTPTTSGST